MFAFPEAGRGLEPSVFRGQIDYEVRTKPDPLRELAYQNGTYSVYRLTAK